MIIHIIKTIIRCIITLPQMGILLLKGIKIKNINEYLLYTSFFRHFPFAGINKNGTVSFNFEGKKVKMFYGDASPVGFSEVFRRDEYGKLISPSMIKGSDVVDIGAAWGDTAVYFGLKGAKKVYGYEINPRSYELCRKNIALNGLGDVCSVELCGVSGGVRFSDFSRHAIGVGIDKKDVPNFNDVKMKTLNEIVKEHNIQDGILKIDVDGFEYDILREADKDTLESFKNIIMEYHFGTQDLLTKLTECGFKVNASKPLSVFIDYHPKEFQQMEVGYISATRI